MIRLLALIFYYGIARFLPSNTTPFIGGASKALRRSICKMIFKKSGDNINIERMVYFGDGRDIIIGNNSGIGSNSHVTNNIEIGDNVMIAPELLVLGMNHQFERTDIPMNQQGVGEQGLVKIEDDVWIGRRVIITRDTTISKGSILASGAVITKNVEPYSIMGGNPAKIIKKRQ